MSKRGTALVKWSLALFCAPGHQERAVFSVASFQERLFMDTMGSFGVIG